MSAAMHVTTFSNIQKEILLSEGITVPGRHTILQHEIVMPRDNLCILELLLATLVTEVATPRGIDQSAMIHL
jgi:hypothetical protein